MKKLVATIALLCMSSTVLAHDIYSNLRDRDGHLCCGGQDCRPVQAVVLPNGNYYLPESDETIPANMASPSPDERFSHTQEGEGIDESVTKQLGHHPARTHGKPLCCQLCRIA